MPETDTTPDLVAPLIGVVSRALGLTMGEAVRLRQSIEDFVTARDDRIRSAGADEALRIAMDTEVAESGYTLSLERLAKQREATRAHQNRFVSAGAIDSNLTTTTAGN